MIKPCYQEKTIGEKNANTFYHKEVGSTFALNSMCEKGHYILHIQYSHFHSKVSEYLQNISSTTTRRCNTQINKLTGHHKCCNRKEVKR